NAVVFIDNERVGTTPYKSDKMPSGTYSVRIVKEMYDAVENTFIIEDGMTTLAEMNLSADFMKLTVKADPDSDIYIDSEYKGKGEWNGEVLFGTHYLEARKENHKPAVMKVELDKNSTNEFVLENPRPITGHIDINTTPMKADIYLDGKHYGTTPKVISNIIIGVHKLKLEKDGYVTLEKDIVVEEGEMLSLNEKLLEDVKQQPAKQKDDKVKSVDGKTESVNFLTLNAAYSVAPQISFGFTYGQVKKIGWFVSAMTGTSFEGFNVNGRSYEEAALTGETASSRLSITGGVALRLGNSPVYLKAGAGYGMRVRACETIHGDYVEYTPDTYKGLEMTAGLQFNLKKITLGVDAVTTNFKYLELKLGVGINWN
ncbi:MAG: PEGA domain-containing protein, partial [Bacteroidales bacterium]|nr:PEGA domain-containing protein [Bacteroidales bacterium]